MFTETKLATNFITNFIVHIFLMIENMVVLGGGVVVFLFVCFLFFIEYYVKKPNMFVCVPKDLELRRQQNTNVCLKYWQLFNSVGVCASVHVSACLYECVWVFFSFHFLPPTIPPVFCIIPRFIPHSTLLYAEMKNKTDTATVEV